MPIIDEDNLPSALTEAMATGHTTAMISTGQVFGLYEGKRSNEKRSLSALASCHSPQKDTD